MGDKTNEKDWLGCLGDNNSVGLYQTSGFDKAAVVGALFSSATRAITRLSRFTSGFVLRADASTLESFPGAKWARKKEIASTAERTVTETSRRRCTCLRALTLILSPLGRCENCALFCLVSFHRHSDWEECCYTTLFISLYKFCLDLRVKGEKSSIKLWIGKQFCGDE